MSTEATASEHQWYWSKQGSDERNGPIGREQLEKLAEKEDLEPEDLVWRKGFDDWKEAGSVEEIEDLFASPPPLPGDPSDEKGEEPPTLPQSEPNGGRKVTKSEAMSCSHDYDGTGVCLKCGWSKTELKKLLLGRTISAVREAAGGYIFPVKLEAEQSASVEDPNFPVEFEVNWGGSFSSSESTLQLHRDKISLHTNDWVNHGGDIDYSYFKIKEREEKTLTVKAPAAFDENQSTKTHYLEFKSSEEISKFVKIIKVTKGIGMEEENSAKENNMSLKIRKQKVSLIGKEDKKFELDCDQVKTKNRSENEMVLEVPTEYSKNIYAREKYPLVFDTKKDAKRANKTIKDKKREIQKERMEKEISSIKGVSVHDGKMYVDGKVFSVDKVEKIEHTEIRNIERAKIMTKEGGEMIRGMSKKTTKELKNLIKKYRKI